MRNTGQYVSFILASPPVAPDDEEDERGAAQRQQRAHHDGHHGELRALHTLNFDLFNVHSRY